MRAGVALGLAALLAAVGPAAAQPQGIAIRTFSAEDLLKGTTVSRENCGWLPKSVFVEAEGEGVCIRYYISGEAKGRAPAVFFPGDSFGFDEKGKIAADPGYLTQAPEYIDAAIRVWAQRLGSPVIFFGRMGLHGSSGWHGNRRTRLEVAVTRAALDAIKAKEGLSGFHVGGQSGGGLLAAAVVASRTDIGCAAIASAPLDFPAFAKRFGITLRKEGKRAHHDMMREAGIFAERSAATRVIVLSDPKDAAVPLPIQQAFVDAVRAAGGRVLHLLTSGRGKERHALTEKTMFSLALCIRGRPDAEIEKTYGNTGPDDLPPP